MFAITVGKKWDKGAVYVGRPSPLGNPFVLTDESRRDEVCDRYETWLRSKVEQGDPAVLKELRRLYRLAQDGPVVLGCYCAPRRCHADSIKRFLESLSA